MAKSSKPQAAPSSKASPRRAGPSEVRQTKKQIAHGKRQARQNRIIWLSVAALGVIVVAILGAGLTREILMKPGSAIAIVDGTKIRNDDYEALVKYRRANLNSNIQNLESYLQGLDTTDQNNQFLIAFYQQQLDQLKSELANVGSGSLDELIDDALVHEKAKEAGIAVTAADVQKQIDDDLQRIVAPTTQPVTNTQPVTDTQTVPTATSVPQSELDRVYQNALTSMGLADKQFRTILQRSLRRTKVQDLLSSQVPTTGLVVHVQMIVTTTQEIASATEARIKGGEDFAAVAKEVSSDSQAQDNGGDMGWLAQGQTARRYGQPVEDWVFAQEPGAIGIVESNGQFYVVKVVEKNENGPLPADELSYRQTNALTDWLTQRKASPDTKIERLLQPTAEPSAPLAVPQPTP